MNYRHFFRFICFLIIFNATLATSAEAQETTEADFFGEAPLILTASRMSKPLAESPASVSIIDRQMIEASGAREIAELFRMVPGFIVGHVDGGKPLVTYQGMGRDLSRQMQVLVDGRSVFIPSFGGIPWTNLPLLLEDIERIEIIRGPNAVTYGANAFLATINIITRHAAEDFGARYSITASDNSNPDIGNAYLRLGFHHGDLDWRLSIGTLNDDGFAGVNDSSAIDKFNFRLDYLSANNQSWTFQLGRNDSTSEAGEPGDFDNIERDTDTTNSYLNILWERNLARSTSSIRLAHTEQEVVDNFFADDSANTGFTLIVDFDHFSKRTDLELIQTRDISDNFRLAYGGSLRKDRVKSLFLFNGLEFPDIDTARLFTSLEWRLDQNLLVDLGVTIEDSSLTDPEISPRLSIIHKLKPNHAFRFVISKAKRNPILYEHSGSTIFSLITPSISVEVWKGNPNIQPENIVSYELGLRSQFKEYSVSSDIRLFTYRISDHIVRVASGDFNMLGSSIKTSANEGSTRVTGLELALDFSPTPNFDIKSGFSFVGVESAEINFEKSFPDKTAFVTAKYRWNLRHNFSASLYYIDEMEWRGSPQGSVIKPIHKLDLRYAYTLDQKSETHIELVGQNLLEEYIDYKVENLTEPIIRLKISGGF